MCVRGRIGGSIHGDDDDDDDDGKTPSRATTIARGGTRCVRSRCVRTVDDEDAGVVGGGVEQSRGADAVRYDDGDILARLDGRQGGAGKVAGRGVCRRRRWRWR